MITHRSRAEQNLSPWIFHCCCVLSFPTLLLSFMDANRTVEQRQQWLWFWKLTIMSTYCHCCLLLFIFLKCLFSRVILISVTCYRPPAPLESTTFPLFHLPIPSDVCERGKHLISCRYGFVWYDSAESLFAFQRKFPFRFSVGPVCAMERATVEESAHALHELVFFSLSLFPCQQQCDTLSILIPVCFPTWKV